MVKTRWMVCADMPRILAIENASFPDPWREEEFVFLLKDRAVIGRVAVDLKDNPVGYIVTEGRDTSVHIWNLAVDPSVRRNHVGSLLVG